MIPRPPAKREIISMRPEHVRPAVALYLRSFEGTFLARLGPQILELMFDSYVRGSPREVSLVCIEETNEVTGFVCGSSQRALYIRNFLHKHFPALLAVTVGAVIHDRGLGGEIIRRVRSLLLAWRARLPSQVADLPPASLMTIAVAEDYRRQGVGAALVVAFTERMARQGVPLLRLAVGNDNGPARRLYERLGWRLRVTDAAYSSGVCFYVKELSHVSNADSHDRSQDSWSTARRP